MRVQRGGPPIQVDDIVLIAEDTRLEEGASQDTPGRTRRTSPHVCHRFAKWDRVGATHSVGPPFGTDQEMIVDQGGRVLGIPFT